LTSLPEIIPKSFSLTKGGTAHLNSFTLPTPPLPEKQLQGSAASTWPAWLGHIPQPHAPPLTTHPPPPPPTTSGVSRSPAYPPPDAPYYLRMIGPGWMTVFFQLLFLFFPFFGVPPLFEGVQVCGPPFSRKGAHHEMGFFRAPLHSFSLFYLTFLLFISLQFPRRLPPFVLASVLLFNSSLFTNPFWGAVSFFILFPLFSLPLCEPCSRGLYAIVLTSSFFFVRYFSRFVRVFPTDNEIAVGCDFI